MKPFKIVTEADREEYIKRIRAVKLNQMHIGIFKRIQVPRTLPQNNLYQLWVTAIRDQTGNEKKDIKLYLREKFLWYEEKVVFGKAVKYLVSTADISREQFSTYLQDIYDDMAGHGITIFWPREEMFKEFYLEYNYKEVRE